MQEDVGVERRAYLPKRDPMLVVNPLGVALHRRAARMFNIPVPAFARNMDCDSGLEANQDLKRIET